MARRVTSRLISAILVALAVATAVFAMLRLSGDPVDVLLGPDSPVDARAALRHQLGLDQPLPLQYAVWLGAVARGDLGRSIATREDVTTAVVRHIGPTLLLSITSTVIAAVVGVVCGVSAAAHPRSVVDRLTLLLATLGTAMPSFWVGLLMVTLLSVQLNWLPDSGMFSPLSPSWSDVPAHLMLPALTLALPSVAVVARLTRTAVREALAQDYIRTAHGKGLDPRHVLTRHALRNGLLPVATIVGIQFTNLLAGAVVIEATFSWPGVGLLLLHAIFARDFPVVQGTVLYVALVVVLVTAFVDLLYVWVDPRLRAAT